jgi:hypothetical protein
MKFLTLVHYANLSLLFLKHHQQQLFNPTYNYFNDKAITMKPHPTPKTKDKYTNTPHVFPTKRAILHFTCRSDHRLHAMSVQ